VPTVACTVRSTASRTASGTGGAERLFAIAAVSHIVIGLPASPPIHLRPAADLAERVLLPGDPARALAVAQLLTEQPRMFNHHRGLWGYTGIAADGEPLTVQATGMGGPSAAIVVEELIGLGARTLIRIGTAGAIDSELELGQLVVATEAIADDGASTALGAGERVTPDPALTEALTAAAAEAGPGRGGPVATSDLFYDPRDDVLDRWRAAGALAVEMEAATVLRVAERHGAAAGCLLAMSDLIGDGERRRIGRDELEKVGLELGRVAWAALTACR
jgi:DeoD family purine-nucleoside phosphorylase